MSREESLVAVLTTAKPLLRASGWPACRGQPSVAVLIGVLAALAGAVASVVQGDADVPLRGLEGVEGEDHSGRCADRGCWCWTGMIPVGPQSHQEGQSAAQAVEMDIWVSAGPEGRTERRLREADEGPPGVCVVGDCWRGPIKPGGVCHFHTDWATATSARIVMRDPVFTGGEDV